MVVIVTFAFPGVKICQALGGCSIDVGDGPMFILIDGTGAYVSNGFGTTVSVIDMTTNSVDTTITVGSSPRQPVKNGTGIYIVNYTTRSISIIDSRSNTVAKTILIGNAGMTAPVSTGTGVFIMSSSSGTVVVIDVRTNTKTREISVGSSPIAGVVSGTGLYIANNSSSNISLIDLTKQIVVKTITVGSTPQSLAVSGTGVYVTNFLSNTVSIIDTRTNTKTKDITTGTAPNGIAANGTGVYVSNYGGTSVSVINTQTNTIIRTITVGSLPLTAAFNGTGVYVANLNGHSVSIIDSRNLSVVATVAIGSSSNYINGMAIGTDAAYVLARTDNQVDLIDLDTNAAIEACTAPVCGNSSLTGFEECDDGNTTSGDGCSNICRIEDDWECSGTGPGSCSEIDSCTADTYYPLDSTGSFTVTGSPDISDDVPSVEPSGGKSIIFDGSNDYLRATRAVADDFTICAWFKTTGTGATTEHWRSMALVDSEVGGAADDFGFGVDSNGKLVFGASDYTVNGATAVNTGDWVNGCVTRRKITGMMRLYVNGVLDASLTGVETSLDDNDYMYIGHGLDGGVHWNGNIDELRFYNSVLSASQIAEIAAGTQCYVPSSSSSSSSSTTSSSSQSRQATGGHRGGSTHMIKQTLMSRDQSIAPQSSSSKSSTSTMPNMQTRTCARVMKWFGGDQNALVRVNVRLMKWLGFSCK